jgi:alpha-tubulin suppressor-like RCC1 family protein
VHVWTGGGPTGTTVYRDGDANLRTIGHNGQGQCGNGNVTTPQLTAQTPQFSGVPLNVTAVTITGLGQAAPTTRVHVLTPSSGLFAFGAGATGVLSTEGAFTASVSTPRLIPNVTAAALAPAGDATGGLAARTSAGRVFAGGTNNEGALGISPDLLTAFDGFSPVIFGA